MATAETENVEPLRDPHGLAAYGIILDLLLECCAAFAAEQSAARHRGELAVRLPAWCRSPIRPASA